ncbi:VOC family protein [bacterium]|nr:VOC family protein [bacterium]
MIKGINHLGIVVENIDEMVSFLSESFGAEEIKRIDIPQMQQISSLVRIGNDCLELMEPTSPEGTVGRFLKSKGGGLHHISLLCEDVAATCAQLESKGLQIVGKVLNDDFRVAFIHPKSGKGVLYELTDQSSLDRTPE